MSSRNRDNRLKCDVSGYRGWMPTNFHEGKDASGRIITTPGFKNVLTDQEITGSEPPCPTGDLACVRHSGDAFREGWERIWGGAKNA